MVNLTFANINGSMPTTLVAVESTTNNAGVKMYRVPMTAQIHATLTGDVQVYAASEDEAITKVQEQIDGETVDRDTEMEDFYSGYRMSYADVSDFFGSLAEIDEDSVEVDDEEVDPADVLEKEIAPLKGKISWSTDTLEKHKGFLKSLLNEGDDGQSAGGVSKV